MDELTAWEFVSAVEGWKAANGAEQGPATPSPDEHDEMIAKYG